MTDQPQYRASFKYGQLTLYCAKPLILERKVTEPPATGEMGGFASYDSEFDAMVGLLFAMYAEVEKRKGAPDGNITERT